MPSGIKKLDTTIHYNIRKRTKPFPRNVWCALYDDCLDKAARLNWISFTCEDCSRKDEKDDRTYKALKEKFRSIDDTPFMCPATSRNNKRED